MKIKKYKCNCQFALYPFGSGAPVCIYDRVTQKNHSLPLKPCTEKGCEHKKPLYINK